MSVNRDRGWCLRAFLAVHVSTVRRERNRRVVTAVDRTEEESETSRHRKDRPIPLAPSQSGATMHRMAPTVRMTFGSSQ